MSCNKSLELVNKNIIVLNILYRSRSGSLPYDSVITGGRLGLDYVTILLKVCCLELSYYMTIWRPEVLNRFTYPSRTTGARDSSL